MAESDYLSNRSYIEEKVISLSEKAGIQKELLLKTPFEEIERKLGIAEERLFEFGSSKTLSPEKIKGSVFIHFASPILKRDISRKQKYIDKFLNRRGMGR